MKVNIFLSLKYIIRQDNKGYFSFFSVISIIGIIIGIAVLITVISVMNGFQINIKNKIIALTSFHLRIESMNGEPIKNFNEVIDKVKKIKGVKEIFGIIESPVLFNNGSRVSGAIIRSYTDNFFNSDLYKKNIKILKGIKKPEEGKCIVGKEFANLNFLGIDSKLSLISMQKSIFLPSYKIVTIGGLFKSGYYPIDSSVIYLNFSDAQKFLGLTNSCISIGIIVKDLGNLDYLKNIILKKIRAGLTINTWYDYNINFYEALKNEKRIMFFIIFLIIVVANFNMISSQVMLIQNKKKEIGILKAIGFTPFDIKAIFVIYGTIIGVFGNIMGIALGFILTRNIDFIFDITEKFVNLLLHFIFSIIKIFNPYVFTPVFKIFSRDIYYFDKIPVIVKFSDILFITILSMIVIFISSLIPAHKASIVKPHEVIHNE